MTLEMLSVAKRGIDWAVEDDHEKDQVWMIRASESRKVVDGAERLRFGSRQI